MITRASICSPLGPVLDHRSRTLLLGSMPSEISIAEGQYYANPRNQFWKIIYAVFDAGAPPEDYGRRVDFVLSKGVAIWDVLQACGREGSADESIVNAIPNDFSGILNENSNINMIIFNGARAARLFAAMVPERQCEGLVQRTLPSSSPAYASMSIETKIDIWRRMLTPPWNP